MTTTEIKKELYKQKPVAYFQFIRMGVAYYDALIKGEHFEYTVNFQVPVSDMGDTDFHSEMDAKLLNRYIVES